MGWYLSLQAPGQRHKPPQFIQPTKFAQYIVKECHVAVTRIRI